MDKESRICIIGAGAIGGVVAGVLARKGYQIQLVVKHPELAEKIGNRGIEVKGECGNFTIPVPSVAKPNELSGTFDYVLIATKAEGLVDAAIEMLPYLHKNPGWSPCKMGSARRCWPMWLVKSAPSGA